MKILLLLIPGIALAQSGLDRPLIGVMADSTGLARPVHGVSATVTADDPVAADVISYACSSAWCIYKASDAIVAQGQTVAAPAGPAVMAIDGDSALIYFSDSDRLARWRKGRLDPVRLRMDGQILSMRSINGAAQFAVRRRGSTWIVDEGGRAVGSIPVSTGPVMLFTGGVVYLDGDQVVLRRDDASEVRFSAPGAQSFSAMGANYVQIRTSLVSYALRTDPGHEKIFVLPEAAQ